MFRIYVVFVLLSLALLIAEFNIDILILSTFILMLVIVFRKVGNGLFFAELLLFHAALICLFAPWLGYEVYNQQNALAKLWVRFMPIPKEVYFSFLLPAIWMYGLGLLWPFRHISDNREPMFHWRKALPEILRRVPISAIHTLLIAGLVSNLLSPFISAGLQQVFVFINFSFFTACFYVFYHPAVKVKWPYVVILGVYVVYVTLSGGMFTLIINMGAIILMLLLLTTKVSTLRKLMFFALGFAFIIFIQFFKMGYRQATWINRTDDKTSAINAALITSSAMVSKNNLSDAAFPIYFRMNQGFNIGKVIEYIPKHKPFAEGYELGVALASAFVPRILWNDKPTAGGQYNMKRYAGLTIRSYSTNVGPIGEAYGNFGLVGGAVYCFFFALFLKTAYGVFLRNVFKNPVMLFWMPVIFFQIIYVAENDSLQAFNSLLKSAVFILLMRFLFPVLFRGVSKKKVLADVN